MRLWFRRAALTALAALILLEVIIIRPRADAIGLVGIAAWMALPGVALVSRVLAGHPSAPLARWLIGPALGFGFSVFGLLLWWIAGVQNWLALVLAPALTWILVWVARRFGGPSLQLPALDRRDVAATACTLLVVPLITFAPYDHVAEPVEDGQAYRAYFTADFVWAMTVTAELAKGDVPPVNPFLRGEPVRYYWLSHMLSGAIYRNGQRWGVTAEQVVLMDGLAFSLVFVSFLYYLARTAGGSPAFSALAVMVGFLANSYEAVERLWLFSQSGQPLDLVKTLNIDAVTRWFYQGMPVDGLQRLLLYQPHHLTGYVCALSALWLVAFAEDVTETAVALWAGILLGLAFLFSTFTAIIVGGAIGLLYAARLLARRAFGALWQCAILGGGPVLVAIGISSFLGYTNPADGLLIQFGVNPVALRRWPLVLLLSLGPLLFALLAGSIRPRWLVREGRGPAVLVVSALAFYFLADVPDMGGVWVGWRSGHLLLMAGAITGASALTAAWRVRSMRIPLAIVMVVALGLAVPTAAIDVYNAQDITNRGAGPAFPWTLIITPAEREALDWIKRATPPDAVVQTEAFARGAGGWAYVPAFAERRMAAGLPISMIPLRPYQVATENVRLGIFNAASAADAHAMARFMGIDYLVVGEVERRWYSIPLGRLAARPDLFPPVFRNDAIVVFGVAK